MIIPNELVYGIAAGIALQLGVQLISYGKLTQKVNHTQEELTAIKNRLNDGFTCKFHAEFAEKVGRIEGTLQTARDEKE